MVSSWITSGYIKGRTKFLGIYQYLHCVNWEGGVTGGSDSENLVNMKSGFEFKPRPRLPTPALHVLSKL